MGGGPQCPLRYATDRVVVKIIYVRLQPAMAFNRPSIVNMFQGRLEALKRQSEITDRKVAATIARARQLIADQQAEEAKWAAEHPDLV